MSTTTMGQTPEVTAGAAQTPIEPSAGAMRHVWWAALGLVAVAGQQTGRVLGKLVQKGKEFEPAFNQGVKKAGKEVSDAVGAVGAQIKGAGEMVGKAPEKLEGMVDERVAAALERIGVPKKDEIQALADKVDEVSTKIEELKAKLGKTAPPARAGD